jgi:kynureninase
MFHRPIHNHLPVSYFCGHSLGLQPIDTKEYLALELDKWAKQGVEGHFEEPNPWFHYHHFLKPGLAHLCGAKESEVVAYGSLTSNLHFLLASFYQPTTRKHKILAEDVGFPSDTFALETHVKFRGFNPKESIVWLKHDANFCFTTDYILSQIEEFKDELELIWLSGVNFLSGQVADMKEIARVASQNGIKIGFDLAHAIGNVPLKLHDWGIDFAVWCSYKYLNAGPGAVGGYFVHEKNFPNKPGATNYEPNILGGWWGNKEETRFQTKQSFDPIPNADAWQHSNANVLSLAALRASLDIFFTNQIADLHAKSSTQTKIAFEWLQNVPGVQILTPLENSGNMLSVMLPQENKKLIAQLKSKQIMADWREPNIFRFSFCPLYNTTEEWQQFMAVLHELL